MGCKSDVHFHAYFYKTGPKTKHQILCGLNIHVQFYVQFYSSILFNILRWHSEKCWWQKQRGWRVETWKLCKLTIEAKAFWLSSFVPIKSSWSSSSIFYVQALQRYSRTPKIGLHIWRPNQNQLILYWLQFPYWQNRQWVAVSCYVFQT